MTDILPPAGWPNVRQLETNEFATGGTNGNMNEQAKSLAARSELLKQYAALPYESKTGGYALNERVQLATGDVVRSTIASNVNNPNENMTGWVLVNSDSQIKTWTGRSQELENRDFDSNIKTNKADIVALRKDVDIATNILAYKQTISIQHFRQDGQIYDVAILNVSPNKFSLKGNHAAGQPLGYMTTTTAKHAAYKFNSPVVCNASAFSTTENPLYLRPYGVYIEDGVVYSDWNTSAVDRNQACCMMSDGSLKRYLRADANAQQMVDDGAVWGVAFGAWCVYDGVIPSGINETGAGAVTSGRTVIGQRADGTYLIIMIEGVTNSYGANGQQCGEIALRHGAVRAFICDGGGSSQLWWNDCYAMPSSDTTYRPVAAVFAIDVESAPTYDSGIIALPSAAWVTGAAQLPQASMYIQQLGRNVNFYMNGVGFSSGQQVTADPIPLRYRPRSGVEVRQVQSPVGGGLMSAFMGGTSAGADGIIKVVTAYGTVVNTTGACNWIQKVE